MIPLNLQSGDRLGFLVKIDKLRTNQGNNSQNIKHRFNIDHKKYRMNPVRYFFGIDLDFTRKNKIPVKYTIIKIIYI